MSKKETLATLKIIFQKHKVLDIDRVYAAIDTSSHATAFRYLKDLHHLTSYTHNGKFYTLPEIAQFNKDGFWYYGDIGFSLRGTLTSTLEHLITVSESGKTNSELEKHFRTRVQRALQVLLSTKKIAKANSKKPCLYVSQDPCVRDLQVRNRSQIGDRRKLPDWITAEILVEAIRSAPVQPGIDDVSNNLAKRGSLITREQVKQVFEENDLEKKTLD
jgi:hypothetical protein